jgi:hypothetical protein
VDFAEGCSVVVVFGFGVGVGGFLFSLVYWFPVGSDFSVDALTC